MASIPLSIPCWKLYNEFVMKKQTTLLKDWGKYKGSIVMTVDDQIYSTKQPKKIAQLLKEIEKKHHKKPLITVVPKEDTLILVDFS